MKSLQRFIKESIESQESIFGRFQEDDHRGYYGPICEMALVGYIPKKNRLQYYEVVVWADDPGYIPHVHIRDVATQGKEFDCCVKLESPEYFPHGRHTGKLNSQMKDEFIKFMAAEPTKNRRGYKNNYEMAAERWNENNTNHEIDIQYDADGNPVMPDYSKL